jgi:HAMP domain-containing protein
MRLAILKVILWPKDTSHAPRIIPFEPGRINIISGENGSGKSTITWIIDYCLGSEKCSIPVGLIRNVTGWFGLHLRLANTEMIVARRNPGDQQATNEMYWTEGLELGVPAIIAEKNARVEDLKYRFNQISNLPSLDFAGGEDIGFGGRPSFRDMSSFNFQPQHIVANPYTFFYKADTTENREKLKIILPLVLGAVTASTLATQRELKDLEREFERMRRELEARLNAARAWETEVESYYLQARGLGLLAGSEPHAAGWSLDKYILELRRVPALVEAMDIPDVQEGTNEAAALELNRVVSEEDQLAQETGSTRRRLDKVEQLSTALDQYGGDLVSQEDRLQGVGWFEEKLQDTHVCPVCAALHTDGNARLADLKTLAQEMTALTASVHQAPAKLDQELAALRVELREKEGALSKARQKRKYLEAESTGLAAQRQRVRQIYLFVGRVEQALENVSASRNVDELQSRVKTMGAKIAQLRRDLDPSAQRDRLSAAVDRVSATIAEYARLLRLEHRTENVRLNVRELTLQFSPLSGRTDFLWEVGSGQNWVGYHIAGMLALHEHFVSIPENPVPDFLVIDQPSQVYFPEAWPSMEETPETNGKSDRSPDIEGVHRIFSALSVFLDTVSAEFQIIVTEHAGSITWRGLPHVHVVGNWRVGQDEFLIPADWIPQE